MVYTTLLFPAHKIAYGSAFEDVTHSMPRFPDAFDCKFVEILSRYNSHTIQLTYLIHNGSVVFSIFTTITTIKTCTSLRTTEPGRGESLTADCRGMTDLG